MKHIVHYYSVITLIITFFSPTNLLAQEATVEVNQDNKIDVLLKVKKDVNASEANYKIQIYSGNRPGAENASTEFRNTFGEWTSTMEFETPNYKIWVGNFKSRLEADRALLKIKQKFTNAFYFKPKKN